MNTAVEGLTIEEGLAQSPDETESYLYIDYFIDGVKKACILPIKGWAEIVPDPNVDINKIQFQSAR